MLLSGLLPGLNPVYRLAVLSSFCFGQSFFFPCCFMVTDTTAPKPFDIAHFPAGKAASNSLAPPLAANLAASTATFDVLFPRFPVTNVMALFAASGTFSSTASNDWSVFLSIQLTGPSSSSMSWVLVALTESSPRFSYRSFFLIKNEDVLSISIGFGGSPAWREAGLGLITNGLGWLSFAPDSCPRLPSASPWSCNLTGIPGSLSSVYEKI